MRLKLLLAVGLVLSIASSLQGAEPQTFRSFSAIDRSFSVSTDLTVSEDLKRLERRLETAPPEDIPLRQELARQYNHLPPPYLFDLAERTFSADVRAAIEWYWLGYIRASMDAELCADTSAVEAVAYLPARARTVAKYIRVNPNVAGEIGEQVLTRSDLLASQASPWWICSRSRELGTGSETDPRIGTDKKTGQASTGDKTAGEGSVSWLVPHDQMAVRYAKLMSDTREMFQQLKQPMEDHITSLVPAIVPTVVTSRRSITNLLWSHSQGLVMTEAVPRKASRLLVWNKGILHTLETDVGGPNLCLASDFVSYRIRAPKTPGRGSNKDADAPKALLYKAGLLGQELQQYSHQYYGRGVSTGGFQRARAIGAEFANWSQSSLTCKWRHADEVKQASYEAATTVRLGEARGFLQSTAAGTFHYATKDANAMWVSDNQYPLKCMKFIPFLDAIHMAACPVSYVSAEGEEMNRNLLGVSLLKLGGPAPEIEVTDLPLIPGERSKTQTLITKVGIIRLMKSRYTPVRQRPGGLYWFGWSGEDKPKKIWEGYPDQADVSDDGCRVAFSTIKSAASIGRNRTVLLVNVCDALAKPADR